MARKPVSIEIIEENDGSRSVVRTFADGSEKREAVDLARKGTRRPRLRQHRIKSDRVGKTRRKQI